MIHFINRAQVANKRFFCFLSIFLCATNLAFSAVIGTCNGRVVNGDNAATSAAYLVWSTDTNGDVIIRIIGQNGDETTVFRGNGMQANGFYLLPQNGKNCLLSDSMNVSINAAKTEIRWTKKNGFEPKVGDVIRFISGKNIEWKTAQAPNAYSSTFTMDYMYGDICNQLPTPSINTIADDGTILFEPVEGADAYMAYIYQGDALMDKQIVSNGSPIQFTSYNTFTYSIRLQALGWSSVLTNSDLSEPVNWTPIAQALPLSPLCGEIIGSGNSTAYLSWQTDAKGNIVITIDGEAGTTFRGNGMCNDQLGSFIVGGEPASTYFTREYLGTNTSSFTLVPKEGITVPSGLTIRYSGTIEWKTAKNNNAYGNYSMEYIYGTVCPTLTAPIIEEITPEGVISFQMIENATSYIANIYRSDLSVYSQTVVSGDSLHFEPISTDTYIVYLTAKSLTHQPATSEQPYLWFVEGSGEDLSQSTICNKVVSNNDGGVYLSIETDEDGNIIFTLSGPNNPTWRGAGLQTELLTIQGTSLQNYFDKQAEFPHTPTLILMPKLGKPNVKHGDIIEYKGNVEWYITVDGIESAPWISNFSFTYVYGSTCKPLLPRLQTPIIISVDEKGFIEFEDVPNANSYLAYMYDADEVYLDAQDVHHDIGIKKGIGVIPAFTYLVRLQAWPEKGSSEYRESKLSAPAEWYFPMTEGIEDIQQDERTYRLYTIDGILIYNHCTRDQLTTLGLHGIFIMQHPTNSQIILLP